VVKSQASDGKARDLRDTDGGSPTDGLLRGLFDLHIVLLLFAAPLFFGGRYEGGRAVFVTLVASATCVSSLRIALAKRPAWAWTSAEPLFAAGAALVLAQLIEWPTAWLDRLSPAIGESLPLWRQNGLSGFAFGEWRTVSLAPSATRDALVVFLAYAMLFVCLAQRIRSAGDARRLARQIAAASAFMAALGLAQFLTGTDRFLWWYEHPARTPHGHATGSFANQNHFAQFLVLGMGPLIWTAHAACADRRATGRGAFVVPVCGAGLAALAVLLSLSRGGMLALGVALSAYAAIGCARHQLGRREWTAIAVCVGILATAVGVHGYAPIANRWRAVFPTGHEAGPSPERMALWKADWEAARDFPVLGTGAGTHAEIHPRYLEEQFHVRFTHAENCYLQILLETGIAGAGLMLLAVGLVASWCWSAVRRTRSGSDATLAAALCGSVAASLAHAAFDFPWYVPACMTLTIAVVVVLLRLPSESASRIADSERRIWRMGRIPAGIGAVAVIPLAVLMAHQSVRAAGASLMWNECLRAARDGNDAILEDSDEALGSVRAMIERVGRVLRWDPNHAMAWSRMAALQMRRFDLEQRGAENSIDLAQLRDAVEASRFPSEDAARSWMRTAIGSNMRILDLAADCARRAAELSPWRGEAYLYLAELAFVRTTDPDARDALLLQANRVRPYDGAVVFAMGMLDVREGRVDEAFARWRAIFRANRGLREKLVDVLAPRVGPVVFLLAFSPDRECLQRLFRLYQSKERTEEAVFIGDRLEPLLVQAAEQALGAERAALLIEAGDIAWYSGREDRGIELVRAAVDAAPTRLSARRLLAQRAESLRKYELAVEQLRWCARRAPFDEELKTDLERCEKQRRLVASRRPVENGTGGGTDVR